jgi:putative ABC transport system permease protein
MMMFKIAFRNIFRQKRRTIFTALTILGGFVLAAFSIGWADGSYTFIINMFTRNRLGHIQIHYKDYLNQPSIYKTISNYEEVAEKLNDLDHIESWTPRLFAPGLLSFRDQSTGAQLTGIQPDKENQATRFRQKIIKGELFEKADHKTVLGKGLARVLQASVGDSVVFISQAADGSIANDIYEVCGILESGDSMSDRMAFYLHLQDAKDLMVLYGQIHEIAVIVDELGRVDSMTDRLRDAFDNEDLTVEPWQEFAKSFYHAMKADMEGMWIMLIVIMLIVAVGVLNTVLMSVLERTREYGLLKAMGTKPRQIFKLVIYEVNILTFFSCLFGIALSIILNYWLSRDGITLPNAFTYGGMEFKQMYTTVNLRSILLPLITVFFTAVIVGIFPAIRAAKNDPAQSMRTH